MSACYLQKAPINPYDSKHLAKREFSTLHFVEHLKKNKQNLKKQNKTASSVHRGQVSRLFLKEKTYIASVPVTAYVNL